jgi:hypothetical protein
MPSLRSIRSWPAPVPWPICGLVLTPMESMVRLAYESRASNGQTPSEVRRHCQTQPKCGLIRSSKCNSRDLRPARSQTEGMCALSRARVGSLETCSCTSNNTFFELRAICILFPLQQTRGSSSHHYLRALTRIGTITSGDGLTMLSL